MSSGSFTSPGLGFNNTGKPRQETLACPSMGAEPRGADQLLAGLCVTCGLATTERNPAGHPQHSPERNAS